MLLRSAGVRGLCVMLAMWLAACGDDDGPQEPPDSGRGDGSVDADMPDTALADAGYDAADEDAQAPTDAGNDASDAEPMPVDYIKGSATAADSELGRSLAVDGETIVVGAPGEAGGGGAYVFVRMNNMWLEQAHLHASNRDEDDRFGGSVAIDGDTIVVGAVGERSDDDMDCSGTMITRGEGAAYVFTREDGVWTEQAYLKASNCNAGDAFGYTVAIDADTIAVGAQSEASNATGIDGNGADNSISFSGAVYVFKRDGEDWSQEAYIKASNTGQFDRFGITVAVEGDLLAVGAYFEDAASPGIDGNQLNDAAPQSGAVYLFERDIDTWTQAAYIKASNVGLDDRFGGSLALDGDTLVVGAAHEDGLRDDPVSDVSTDSGAAYVFVRDENNTWSEVAYLKPDVGDVGDLFGTMVAVDNHVIAIGAKDEDGAGNHPHPDPLDNSASNAGAAYVFEPSGGSEPYVQTRYIKASNAGIDDAFGAAVGLGDLFMVVGAFSERGVDNTSTNEGAFYVYGL